MVNSVAEINIKYVRKIKCYDNKSFSTIIQKCFQRDHVETMPINSFVILLLQHQSCGLFKPQNYLNNFILHPVFITEIGLLITYNPFRLYLSVTLPEALLTSEKIKSRATLDKHTKFTSFCVVGERCFIVKIIVKI